MMMTAPKLYAETTEPHTRLMRMGLAASESRDYWLHSDRGLEPEERVRIAFEERWFGSRSMVRVRYLMMNFAYRFDAFPEALKTLHLWAPDEERRVLCHWHLQLTDPFYREFTGEHLAVRREHPEPTVDRNAAIRWMDQKTGGRWAASTTQRMTAGLLGVLNEAGFTSSVAALRPLSLPRVTDRALGYLLYLLRETSFAGSLGVNPYLASVGLIGAELEHRLRRLPGLQFRKLADVSDLTWSYASLWEWAQGECRGQ